MHGEVYPYASRGRSKPAQRDPVIRTPPEVPNLWHLRWIWCFQTILLQICRTSTSEQHALNDTYRCDKHSFFVKSTISRAIISVGECRNWTYCESRGSWETFKLPQVTDYISLHLLQVISWERNRRPSCVLEQLHRSSETSDQNQAKCEEARFKRKHSIARKPSQSNGRWWRWCPNRRN